MARVAILGAGPIGLEAALAAVEHGHEPVVFESAGHVGGHVRRWGHVRTFTPWSMNVSPRARAVLGPDAPDGDAPPTGDELADGLLEPLAASAPLRGRLRLRERVVAVAREGLLKHEAIGSRRGPFRLLVCDEDRSVECIEHADFVIDATGTYGVPNRLGDGGIDAIGERALEHRIDRWLVPFDASWAGRTILLTGAGHGAQTAARELAALVRDAPGTRVVWAVRDPDADFGVVADDPLPERAALNRTSLELAAGALDGIEVRRGVVTEALAEHDGRIVASLRNGDVEDVEVDRVLALNGGVGDPSIYRQLQVHECYATSGPMGLAAALLGESGGDCLAQAPLGPETLRNPEPGFFILGAKSYGRNSQFLLRVGWQQVDDVFSTLIPPNPR